MSKFDKPNSECPSSSNIKLAALKGLLQEDLTLMQLTQAVTDLEKAQHHRKLKLGVSSSVTVDLLNIYLRKYGLLHETRIELVIGNYDDPIGDIQRFKQEGVDQIVLLPFFDNLLPSFESQIQNISSSIIDEKESELQQLYSLVFKNARDVPQVYLGTFHRMGLSTYPSGHDTVSIVINRFNAVLQKEAQSYPNIRIIDTEDIIRVIGQRSAFDSRFYYRGKAPYSGIYMDELARRLSNATRGFNTHFYKVLALDCDNTLWGGIIGEDLISGIKLNPHDYPGNIFWQMQHEFSALERQGILLALVSKNNMGDVLEVFENHPNMVLKQSQIAVTQVNWNDKPSNLRKLAQELNLGLDSFIFLDDSPFECEAVRQQLPMVRTFQVPDKLSDYPNVLVDIKSLFVAGGVSAESKNKTEQYRQRAAAEEIKSQFNSHEEYLASLQIQVELSINSHSSASRISELSQKSNQFNLTTVRYSVPEVEKMMNSDKYSVYSLVVNDKFGSAGLTGVAVLRYELDVATIENFFMSCRVIGRGIEASIWTKIVEDAVKRGCKYLRASFIPSKKNSQVADFYDRIGINLTNEDQGIREYSISTDDFIPANNFWIDLKSDE